jgi:hypothetical protein
VSRSRHLLEIVPDADAKDAPNWTQLIGSAYDRRIYALKIETSEAQDDQLISRGKPFCQHPVS